MIINEQDYLAMFKQAFAPTTFSTEQAAVEYTQSKTLDEKAKYALCGIVRKFGNIATPTENQASKIAAIDTIITKYTILKTQRGIYNISSQSYDHKLDFEFYTGPHVVSEMRKIKKIICTTFEKECAIDLMHVRKNYVPYEQKDAVSYFEDKLNH